MLPNRVLEFMSHNDLPVFIGQQKAAPPSKTQRTPGSRQFAAALLTQLTQLTPQQAHSIRVMLDKHQAKGEPKPRDKEAGGSTIEFGLDAGGTYNHSQMLTPTECVSGYQTLTLGHSRNL